MFVRQMKTNDLELSLKPRLPLSGGDLLIQDLGATASNRHAWEQPLIGNRCLGISAEVMTARYIYYVSSRLEINIRRFV